MGWLVAFSVESCDIDFRGGVSDPGWLEVMYGEDQRRIGHFPGVFATASYNRPVIGVYSNSLPFVRIPAFSPMSI